MDFWQKARSFAEEAAKRTQEFTKEAANRSQDLTIGSSKLSDVVLEASKRSKEFAAEASKRSKEIAVEASKRSKEIAAEASKRADVIVSEASKRADQIKVDALKRAEQIKFQIPSAALSHIVDSSPSPTTQTASPAPTPADLLKFGVTDDLREFVKGITINTFQDFPLEDDSVISDIPTVSNVRQDLTEFQEKHAKFVLSSVKEISKLRYELCPRIMKERKFWRIYFILVNSHVAPYEKKYTEEAEAEIKSVEKAQVESEKEVSLAGTISKPVAEATAQKNKKATSSTSDQDLDVFLLGEDSDDGPVLYFMSILLLFKIEYVVHFRFAFLVAVDESNFVVREIKVDLQEILNDQVAMMEMMPLVMILTRYRLEALNIESLHSNGCLLLGKLGDEVLLDELFLWGNMIKPATSISQCSPYSIPSILPRWVVAFDCSLFCDVFFTGSTEKKVENGGQIVYDDLPTIDYANLSRYRKGENRKQRDCGDEQVYEELKRGSRVVGRCKKSECKWGLSNNE
ncbi:hypothetical protein KY285_012237 [Solanum tuberosum]|nr:hypothetical protein KY285_012237 [Solanum tuberosum]